MQIYNTPQINHNMIYAGVKKPGSYCYMYYKTSPAFNGNTHVGLVKSHSKHPLEYIMRIAGNKFNDLFQTRQSKKIIKTIASIKPERTRQYLEQLSMVGKLYGTKKVIDVNIEDEHLEKLAKKGGSIIFIMNHSNQKEDPEMLAILNALLAEAYKKEGRTDFPLPKIILNEDILSTMNPTKRKAFENFGAVGIDANLSGRDISVNTRAFFPIIKGLVKDEYNMFIFPEGRLAVKKEVELHSRFQDGIANIINKLLGIKKSVTVVPVGFAYGKSTNKDLNSINIGSPIEIKRIGDTTTITKGDILKEEHSLLFDFFKTHEAIEDIPITSKGKPVTPNDVAKYIKTILCENLEINSRLAAEKIQTTKTDIPIIDF